jgi:uncharacterized lipoprotein YmbA
MKARWELMRDSKLILRIGLITAFASVTGCAGRIQYPSYYVLNVPAPVSAHVQSKPIPGSAAIREFSAAGFLKTGAIAYRPSPEQMDFYDYHRWAQDPRDAVTGAMLREIRARGLFQSVARFDGRGSPGCLVTGTIDHLEEVDEKENVTVEVGVSARLIDLRTGEALWEDSALKTTKLDHHSVPGVVAEMSRDLGSVVEQLVASMQDRLSNAQR